MAWPLNEISDIFGGTLIHGDNFGFIQIFYFPAFVAAINANFVIEWRAFGDTEEEENWLFFFS